MFNGIKDYMILTSLPSIRHFLIPLKNIMTI